MPFDPKKPKPRRKRVDQTPGPGAYNIPDSFAATRRSLHGGRFGTGSRFQPAKPTVDALYNVRSSATTTGGCPFGAETRGSIKAELGTAYDNPGPGAYHVTGSLVGNGIGFAGAQRLESSKTLGPGPAYDTSGDSDRGGYSFAGGPSRTAPAAGASAAGPGPGAYPQEPASVSNGASQLSYHGGYSFGGKGIDRSVAVRGGGPAPGEYDLPGEITSMPKEGSGPGVGNFNTTAERIC